MSFMIETSARHIHLTQETVEKLFGILSAKHII